MPIIIDEDDRVIVEATVPAPQAVAVEVSLGPKGDRGLTGPMPQIVVLSLAEYLALPAETQMDGRWYLVPKA
jgi:hypothetical protein